MRPTWLMPLVVIGSLSAPACVASVDSDAERTPSVDATRTRSETSLVPAAVVGRWRFDRLTGVPPDELPHGALPDNRNDLMIARDGTFVWGPWSGTASRAGGGCALVVTDPRALAGRFEDYGASIKVVVHGDSLAIWLPDLGQDRDVDVGTPGEDIDAPDMAFVRT